MSSLTQEATKFPSSSLIIRNSRSFGFIGLSKKEALALRSQGLIERS
jgi:hypothetical protein